VAAYNGGHVNTEVEGIKEMQLYRCPVFWDAAERPIIVFVKTEV